MHDDVLCDSLFPTFFEDNNKEKEFLIAVRHEAYLLLSAWKPKSMT